MNEEQVTPLQAALNAAVAAGGVPASRFASAEKVLPFRNFAIDWLLLRTGGLPVGRVAEVLGPYAAGKSTNGFRMIGSAQAAYPDRFVAGFDTEGRLTNRFGIDWLVRQGVNSETFIVFPEVKLEAICRRTHQLIQDGACCMIVIDSIANASPEDAEKRLNARRETDRREFGDLRNPMEEARIMTEFWKEVAVPLARNEVTILGINQVRAALATHRNQDTETTPGGFAFHHNVALKLRLERVGPLTRKGERGKDEVIGTLSSAEVIKSTFCPIGARTGVDTPGPIRTVYDQYDPLDEYPDVLFGAKSYGVVTLAGAWYDWPAGEVKAQGERGFWDAVISAGKVGDLVEQVKNAIRADVSRTRTYQYPDSGASPWGTI